MAELPPGFRVVQQPSQQPNQLPEGFRVVEQDQPNPYMTGGLGALGQWNSGVNEGLANIIGLPVDVINAGLGLGAQGVNAVLGTDLAAPEQPFLGSESLRGIMGSAILPETEDPQMQFVRRVGEEVGAALPVGLGTMGLAARPAQLLMTELGLAGASGIGAGFANQIAPDNEYADLAGSLLGLGVGAAAPNAMRRVLTPNPNNPAREELAQQLMGDGVDLTAGQRTGNVPLRYAESELGQGAAANFMDNQAEQFTGLALSRAGISANRATPEVMRDAYQDLGRRFDDFSARTNINVDQQFVDNIIDSVQEYMDLVPPNAQAPIVARTLDDLTSLVQGGGGQIAGETYQSYRSRLGRAASGTADPELRSALFDIQSALDDAAERTLAATDPQMLGEWRQLRSDYRNFLVLDRAASAAGEQAASGIITPAQLAGAVRAVQGRRAYGQGTTELAELARAGVGVMSSLPQSGTAARLAARGLPAAIGAGVGASIDPMAAVSGALVGHVLPGMAGRAALSGPGRAYLGNQRFLPQSMPAGAGTSAGAAMLANEEISPDLSPLVMELLRPYALN